MTHGASRDLYATRRRICWQIGLGLALLMAGLVREAEAGVNRWTTTGPRFEGGVAASSLVIAPSVPVAVYAGTNVGVIKTVDGGANWIAVDTNLSGTRLSSIGAIDPSAPNTLYGCGRGGPFKSTDGGGNWTALKSGVIEPIVPEPTFCVTAVDPSNSNTLYGSTLLAGLFKSTDGGKSWLGISSGLPTSLLNVSGVGLVRVTPGATLVIDASVPTTLYAFEYGNGVFKSDDGGSNWVAINTGLPTSVNALAIDPSRPNTLYAGTFLGVFKTTNRGESWIAVNTGLTGDRTVSALVIDPSASATLYAATSNGVFKSTNGGEGWGAVGLVGSAFALAIDPSAPGTVYAAGRDDVFKSTDGGTSWANTNVGRNHFYGADVTAIAGDPSSAGTVYAGTSAKGVFKSTNGGGSWTAINTGLVPYIFPDSLASIGALAINVLTPTTLYAGTAAGVFKSTDGGEHWAAASTWRPWPLILKLLRRSMPAPAAVSSKAQTAERTGLRSTQGSSALAGFTPWRSILSLRPRSMRACTLMEFSRVATVGRHGRV